jgi:hypothetical protein
LEKVYFDVDHGSHTFFGLLCNAYANPDTNPDPYLDPNSYPNAGAGNEDLHRPLQYLLHRIPR